MNRHIKWEYLTDLWQKFQLFKNSFRLAKTCGTLQSVSRSLTQLFESTENDFYQLGEQLQTIYSDADSLSKHTVETIQLIGGKSNEGALSHIDTMVNRALKELNSCRKEANANLSQIQKVIRSLGKLDKTNTVVEQIAMSLRVVGLNIGIESSRSMESSELFGVIAQDVRALAEKILEIAETIRKDIRDAQARQIKARENIHSGLKELDQLSGEARNEIRLALSKINYLISSCMAAMDQAQNQSYTISQEVGKVVVGIQLHDSINQRAQHVIKAIDEIHDIIVSSKQSRSDKIVTLITGLSLQIPQINESASELVHGHDTMEAAFEQLYTSIDNLTKSLSLDLINNENPDIYLDEGEIESIFSKLLDILDGLNHLLTKGHQMTDTIRDMAEEASETANRLSGYMEKVRRISLDIHKIALNAIIKAAHLGKTGDVLEVLSQEMKHLSDYSDDYVKDVEKLIKSISRQIKKLQQHDQAETMALSDKDMFSQRIKNVAHSYETFKTRSMETAQKAQLLKASILQVRKHLGFLPEMADVLKRFAHELSAVLDTVHTKKRSIFRHILPWTERHAQRYTMQKERDIHNKELEAHGHPLSATCLPDLSKKPEKTSDTNIQSKPSDDDLGDNVELF